MMADYLPSLRGEEMLSNMPPIGEAGVPLAGVMEEASRGDHRHPRLSATATGTLNGSGEATITFTRTFAAKPAFNCNYVEAADAQPVAFKVKTWTQDGGGNYTGCVIKGYRSQVVPTNLVTVLLGGVFNLFAGNANGVEYSFIAIQQSSAS